MIFQQIASGDSKPYRLAFARFRSADPRQQLEDASFFEGLENFRHASPLFENRSRAFGNAGREHSEIFTEPIRPGRVFGFETNEIEGDIDLGVEKS